MATPAERYIPVTPAHPELGTDLVSVKHYTSAEYFERERKEIFEKTWVYLAREEEVPDLGSFIVREVPFLRASVLLTRGTDRRVRAFYNICRHRGNVVAADCRGTAKGFTCRFHGWTYDLEGRLASVPDEEIYLGLDKRRMGLKPIATAVWKGFVFICVDPRPRQSLAEFMSDLDPAFDDYPFSEMTLVGNYAATVDVNWKILQDGFLDPIHVAFLHKRTFPDAFTGAENPFGHMGNFELFPDHSTGLSRPNFAHQMTPVEAKCFAYRATGLTMENFNASDFSVRLTHIFPNFIIDSIHGMYFTHHIWPISVNRTYWEFQFYMPPARNAGERLNQEYSVILGRDGVREDMFPPERIQKSVESGGIDHFLLSDQELLVRHYYKRIEEICGRPDEEAQ